MNYRKEEENTGIWLLFGIVLLSAMVYYLSSLSSGEDTQTESSAPTKSSDYVEDLSSLPQAPKDKEAMAQKAKARAKARARAKAKAKARKKKMDIKFHRKGELPHDGKIGKRARADGKKADLLVVDLIQDGPYLFVIYKNAGNGGGRAGEDFGITIKANGRSFVTKPGHRWYIPKRGLVVSTGGYLLSKLGIGEGWMGNFKVIIDPEDRVDESSETNNLFERMLHITDVENHSKLGSLPPRGPKGRPD